MKVERFMQLVYDAKNRLKGDSKTVRIIPLQLDGYILIYFTSAPIAAQPTIDNVVASSVRIYYDTLEENKVVELLDGMVCKANLEIDRIDANNYCRRM